MSIVLADILCALLVGGAIGLLGATVLDWRRERDDLVRQNAELRERIGKLDKRRGWELLSGD